MSKASFSVARHIATRYVSVGKRSQLVSFMSAVSIFGLALGITILITVLSVMNGFDREMRESILGIVPHITINAVENISLTDWEVVRLVAEQDARVLATAPLIEVSGVLASAQGNKSVLVNGIDASSEAGISAISDFLQDGSIEALQQTQWGIVLGATLADRLGVGVGDKVDLFSANISINPLSPQATFRSFQVVGIFKVGTQELDSELVMVNITAARALYRLRMPYTTMRVRLQDVLLADEMRLDLQASLPEGFAVASWTSLFGNIYENIKFSKTIVSFMLWLLIAVAAFNLVVSLIMIVRDKRGDIAILRTLGASPQTINRIFMWQGCMVGVIGTLIGVTLGVLASWQISNFAGFLERAFSIQLLSAEVYPIDYLPSELRLTDVVLVALGVLMLSLLATIYPASRAAAIQPAEALRHE
jgi:lipoprotein-releasing system permease protein